MDEPIHSGSLISNYQFDEIRTMIFNFRDKQVMVDRDIAHYFGIETKRLNEQVKRNKERFPGSFCFRLNKDEKNELVAKCDRFINLKYSSALPFAFTEQGVAMLTAVIKNSQAVSASIYIMNAFVDLRKFMMKNSTILERLGKLELAQIKTDNDVNRILKALDHDITIPTQGIFFDGQVFDAYIFASDLIKTAKTSIILIDNYIDEQTLKILSNKQEKVKLTIFTSKLRAKNELALKRFQEQYPATDFHVFKRSHDRFVILDQKEIYHIGASLKDLGKKWFAFTKLDLDVNMILEELSLFSESVDLLNWSTSPVS